MIYIGVDPGKKGAIAILRPGSSLAESVSVQAMPVVKVGKRDEYNLDLIVATLVSQFGVVTGNSGGIFVTIERQQAMPGGSLANFARGQAILFEAILTVAGVNFMTVPPKVWQPRMLIAAGATAPPKLQRISKTATKQERAKELARRRVIHKSRLILAAEQLFPGVPLQRGRSRKMDDGFADALLIAEFGRRLNEGGL